VFPEVVPEIAALFEYRTAAGVTTPEVKFDAQSFRVSHLDGLVPGVGNPVERFRLDCSCTS
jgi:hypothetical protein